MRLPVTRHRLWQVAVDVAVIAAAWVASWYVRFDGPRPVYYDRYLDWEIVALVVAIKLPVFVGFGFYNRWWRYVSTKDMWSLVRGVAAASGAAFLVFSLFEIHSAGVPRGIWIIELQICRSFHASSHARSSSGRPRAAWSRVARRSSWSARGTRPN